MTQIKPQSFSVFFVKKTKQTTFTFEMQYIVMITLSNQTKNKTAKHIRGLKIHQMVVYY